MAVKREYDSSRRQRQAAQTRADTLAAARRLFAERGYAATTIEAIAAAAEVSEATVYAGFGSKRGLLLAFQQQMQENVDRVEGVREFHAAAGNPAEQIAVAVRISLSFPARYADIIAVMLSARGMDPDVDEFLHHGLVQEHRGAWSMVASGRAPARVAVRNASSCWRARARTSARSRSSVIGPNAATSVTVASAISSAMASMRASKRNRMSWAILSPPRDYEL